MLTQRDKNILKFLENNKAITIEQAQYIFFDSLEISTRRRLGELEERGVITHYYRGKKKVYKLIDESRELSQHDLYILDFYSWIYKSGGEILDFKKTPQYFNRLLIPDAIVKAKIPYQGQSYIAYFLLEIDYTHYTDNTKLNTWYEKLYREDVLKNYCGTAIFPFVVVARPTKGIRYNSKNFNIAYTDLQFNGLMNFIF